MKLEEGGGLLCVPWQCFGGPYGARDGTGVTHMQSMHPNLCPISSTPEWFLDQVNLGTCVLDSSLELPRALATPKSNARHRMVSFPSETVGGDPLTSRLLAHPGNHFLISFFLALGKILPGDTRSPLLREGPSSPAEHTTQQSYFSSSKHNNWLQSQTCDCFRDLTNLIYSIQDPSPSSDVHISGQGRPLGASGLFSSWCCCVQSLQPAVNHNQIQTTSRLRKLSER